MIKQFNKNGAVALYKREFAKCLEASDYEGAIDSLIKYSEAVVNPDFHAAMGTLYFLMTQDSEDRELLPLAFREFLMHLIKHPNSRVAYRNLLAIAILRHDARSIAEVSDFAERRGQNVSELVDELCEFGLSIFSDEGDYIDFDSMFTVADYGAIADGAAIGTDEDGEPVAPHIEFDEMQSSVNRSKIIKFKGNDTSLAAPVKSSNSKIIRLKKNDEPIEDSIDLGDMLDLMLSVTRTDDKDGGDSEDEFDLTDVITDDNYDDIHAKLALKNAQSYCVNGNFENALKELDTIKRESGRLYYCAECIRANIMMDLKRYDEAQLALDRAFAVMSGGALAGTIQCTLHELTAQIDKIPCALKNIDVTDFVDSDHAYRALRYAIKYCSTSEALDFAEDYIDEFNSFDLRSIYAQMLYNAGEREQATKELRILARIQYDDFNAQYYYLMAKAGVEAMPLEDETPQKILGMLVDNIITLVHSELFSASTEIIDSEAFKYGIEVFLTLEFRNTRSVVKVMFETLRTIVSDVRLESSMRNALVSPYVEPLVKAVILGKLLSVYKGKTSFLIEQSFCPMSDDTVPPAGEECSAGYYFAYALTLLCCRKALPFLAECYDSIRHFALGAEFADRDVAYFLWRTVKAKFKYKDKEIDDRVHYALGYDTKAQANAAYKSIAELFPKL